MSSRSSICYLCLASLGSLFVPPVLILLSQDADKMFAPSFLCAFLYLFSWYYFASFRNQWVSDQRLKIIIRNNLPLDDYLSYDEMLNRFWIWDISKLTK